MVVHCDVMIMDNEIYLLTMKSQGMRRQVIHVTHGVYSYTARVMVMLVLASKQSAREAPRFSEHISSVLTTLYNFLLIIRDLLNI